MTDVGEGWRGGFDSRGSAGVPDHKDPKVTSPLYAHGLAEQADQAADTFARVAGID